MIQNKSQFKQKIKENKDNVIIKRIYNYENNNKIPVGSVATVEHIQSNAFTLKWNCLEKATWCYYDSIELKDNKIYYYHYIPEGRELPLGVELIPVDRNDKINKEYGTYSNYLYTHKFVIMVNEIIEKECV